MGNDLVRTRIRFLVLSLLSLKSMHGYALIEEISRITNGGVRPSPGTLYPELRRMANEGLIAERIEKGERGLRRVYIITDKGLQELDRYLDRFFDAMRRLIELGVAAQLRVHEDLGHRGSDSCIKRVEELLRSVEASIKRTWGVRVAARCD